MENLSHALLRSLSAVLLGLVLVLWPAAAVIYLVIAIGCFFIVPGVFVLANYCLLRGRGVAPLRFPIEGAGSLLLGLWMVATPAFFVSFLMYMLGALLLLAGVQQLVALVRARAWCRVSFGFYLLPLLVLLTGVMILAYPFEAVANVFVVFGVASIGYGLVELINWYKFRKQRWIPIE